jgi:hypothetical protein
MNYRFSDKVSTLKGSAIREIFKFTVDPTVISFAAGNPAPESFPYKELAPIAQNILSEMGDFALQYGITEGYAPLIEKVKSRLKDKFGIGTETDDVIITTGGQQGVELSAKVLLNEGDVVITEDPSFIGALNAFRSYGAVLKGVPLNDDGMDLQVLKSTLENNKNVKFIYVIPTFQNPSGVTMSLENRKKLLEIAAEYDVIILEDNPYGELRFEGEDIPTIKSMDTEGRVIYFGSFSKILSPGIRIGFTCANKELLSKIVICKQVSDVHTPLFLQMLTNAYMEQCDIDSHILEIRKLYKVKCAAMLEAADKYLDKRIKITHPEGGLFLYVTMPDKTDISKLCQDLGKNKVAVVPGATFSPDLTVPSYSVRLNFSMPSLENIDKGMKILGEVTKKYL